MESYIGKNIEDIGTPALLVDKKAFENNCKTMLERAKNMGDVKVRGQTKTHKTVEGAIIQTGGTKKCLVTSTLNESEMYADAGFDDILYGYPLLQSHMRRNYALAERLDQYHVMVVNFEGVELLKNTPPPPNKKWSVFLKVDCGYPRSGIPADDENCINIAKALNEHQNKIIFQGLYAHCGNSYSANSVDGVVSARNSAIETISKVANKLKSLGIQVKNVGTGSTPSFSHDGSQTDILTEIHPGNYIFYDIQQKLLGSCDMKDIAAVVMVRIAAHFPQRNEMLIDSGHLALSEQGFKQLGGTFAIVKDHPHLELYHMTQEIGFVRPKNGNNKLQFSEYPIGSILYLYQYHVCDTASRFPVYYVHENGVVVDEWKPTKWW
jgi:D-serine deaminase-like pyridoxal phosphate-dependent protein